MRGASLIVLLLGCSDNGSDDLYATPSGSYTLHQTAQGCAPALRTTAQLTITDRQVDLDGRTGGAFVAPAATPPDEPPNVTFTMTWTETVMADGQTSTIGVSLHYDLWGDMYQLAGTAKLAAPSYRPPCVHDVVSDVRELAVR